ncbi:MAG: type II toxin-antitoxin system RelE/ParE family toxin [Betaproteobacteria bacterium]|nr:type II toxin-antitoxin system RelE/ParE family toxin [Betaproteobacteria bacterium]
MGRQPSSGRRREGHHQSNGEVKGFPSFPRRRAGRQLARVQDGLEPDSWKPMPSIGLGVNEIRIREGGAFRVIYVAKFPEAVYVLHAFEKKAQRTPRPHARSASLSRGSITCCAARSTNSASTPWSTCSATPACASKHG